ncbi:LysM peptidoglycan-binding domain-containing protein [Nitrospira sp. Nam80]
MASNIQAFFLRRLQTLSTRTIVIMILLAPGCTADPNLLGEPSIELLRRQAEAVAKEMRAEAARMKAEVAATRIAAAKQEAELQELREQLNKRRESLERVQKDLEVLQLERDQALKTSAELKAQLHELPHLRQLADEAIAARARVREMGAALALRTAELAQAKLELAQRRAGRTDKFKKPVVMEDQQSITAVWADPVQYVLGEGSMTRVEGGRSSWVTVKPGDTLWSIAQQHKITVSALRVANSLQRDLIVAGQTLLLPSGVATRPHDEMNNDADH